MEPEATSAPAGASDTAAASVEAQGEETSAPAVTARPSQASFTYTIQPGDTVASIAAAFGIDADYIRWNNPGISEDPDLLLVGETLLIPTVDGIVYHVVLGDTLNDVAGYYQIDVESITSFAPNQLASADSVIEGMVLLLPGAMPPPPPPAPAIVEETPQPAPAAVAEPAPVPAGDIAPSYAGGYIWPFYGGISQYFSGYHRGVDIDGFGAYGAPIAAAAAGSVVLAAWDDWGLGYHVIIEHPDGSRTVYGHLSDIWVAQGQYVGQGEAVGALGSSGYSTGPHLHFELRIGGVPVDPLAYLP